MASHEFIGFYKICMRLLQCLILKKPNIIQIYPYMLTLQLEKSISGCCRLNFSRMSNFFCSSAVGRPIAFCLWSYIIFSTVCLVSPSRSLRFEFSGWILCSLIFGSPSHGHSHHSMSPSFWRVRTSRLPSSTVQKESSTMIALVRGASTIGSDWPRREIFRCFFFIVTFRSRPRVLSGRGTLTTSSWSVCVQTYLPSTVPPFPTGGGELSSSSSWSSSLFGSAFCSSSADVTGSLCCSPLSLDFVSSGDTAGSAAEDEMSNPPSALASITPSCCASLAFSFSSCASLAFCLSSSFFLRSTSLLTRASSFFLWSLEYMSRCFFRTSFTFPTAISVPFPGSLPGGPEKKSDFRRRNENTVSRRGSIPCVWLATCMYRPSNRSSFVKSGRDMLYLKIQ
mmetsp:Transcript_26783/g.63514  ORF Transcript_26783/g.63514 Transcript_26783/m.63514 type:complete len:395 (-) Transcript_26783:161-1345(-)